MGVFVSYMLQVAVVIMLSQPAVASVADSLADATVADNRDGKVNESPANLQVAGKVVSIRATETPRVAADGAADAVAAVETEAAAETESGSAEEPQKATEEKKTPEMPAYFVDGKKYDGRLTDLDPNQIASMSIVKDDPAYPQGKIGKWEPATDDGKPVASRFTIPIRFSR